MLGPLFVHSGRKCFKSRQSAIHPLVSLIEEHVVPCGFTSKVRENREVKRYTHDCVYVAQQILADY